METDKTRRILWMKSFVLVAAWLPIIVHIVNSFSARPLADDYCFAYNALNLGWQGAMTHYYMNWQGTFGSTAIQLVVSNTWPIGYMLMPSILLLLWSGGLVWLFFNLCRLFGITQARFISVSLAPLFLFAIMDGASNLVQTLYWVSGSVTYVLPLVALIWFSAYIIFEFRRTPMGHVPRILAVISPFIAAFIAGFTPIVAGLQIVVLLMAMVLGLKYAAAGRRQAILIVLGLMLVGAVVGAVILVAAPGNAIRQAQFPPPPELPMLIILVLWGVAAFIGTSLGIFSPVGPIIVLVFTGVMVNRFLPVPTVTQVRIRRYSRRLLLLTGLIGVILLCAGMFPVAYSVSDIPPARALIVMQTIVIITAVVWGGIMGISLQRPGQAASNLSFSRPLATLLFILLIVGPLRFAVETMVLLPRFQTFAAEWNTRDEMLRTTTEADVIVGTYSYDLAIAANLKTVSDNPRDGINRCVADYYGRDTVATEAEVIDPDEADDD